MTEHRTWLPFDLDEPMANLISSRTRYSSAEVALMIREFRSVDIVLDSLWLADLTNREPSEFVQMLRKYRAKLWGAPHGRNES